MKIIVLGAGKVGKTLIKHMSNEDHDIIVVDQNATKVEEVVKSEEEIIKKDKKKKDIDKAETAC